MKLARNIALISGLAIAATLIVWLGFDSELPNSVRITLLVFLLVPLVFPLHGVWRNSPRACSWLGFLSLVYFTHGVMEAYGDPRSYPWSLIETGLAILMLLAATLAIRANARAIRAESDANS